MRGPEERAAQARLDVMPTHIAAAIGIVRAEAMSDEVWAARARDLERRRARVRRLLHQLRARGRGRD